MQSRKRELEQEQGGWRDQLAHLEQELLCTRAEKHSLEHSCQASEEKQERLDEEISLLRRERIQLQDQIMQVGETAEEDTSLPFSQNTIKDMDKNKSIGLDLMPSCFSTQPP